MSAKVKRAMTTLGRMEESEDPEDEPSGIIDRPLDTALRGFQRDKGLRVDGFMRPGGPTEESLGSDLKGLLGRKSRSFDGVVEGTLNPAAALRAERDDDAQSLLDRAPEPDNRSSSLLDLASRTLAAGGDDSEKQGDQADDRPGRKRRGLASVLDTETAPDAADAEDRSRDRTATALAPKEKEPASLTPFLDKTERNQRRTHEGWRKLGMTDAARHLKHFLDGSGEPITYNRDQSRSFSPVRNAEEEAQELLRKKILKRASRLRMAKAKPSLRMQQARTDCWDTASTCCVGGWAIPIASTTILRRAEPR